MSEPAATVVARARLVGALEGLDGDRLRVIAFIVEQGSSAELAARLRPLDDAAIGKAERPATTAEQWALGSVLAALRNVEHLIKPVSR